MTSAVKPYISLQGVSKYFELSSGRFTALDMITVDFYQSEFTSVVGRSGSGKSTLMNMITGIDKPSVGEINIAGQAIHKLNENAMARWRGKNLGIVFQFYQLVPVFTLLENVMLPMQIIGKLTQKECEEKALRLLDGVNLKSYADYLPFRVSGGQQQCAAIARALANDPPILIADEPTGNLGSQEAERVLGIFSALVSQGKTVVMVTHDEDLAARSQRILRLSDGRLVNDSRKKAFDPAPIKRWFTWPWQREKR